MEVQIKRIENGFIVYDTFSCQQEYCETLDEAIDKLKQRFEDAGEFAKD
jgi:hypothetical protein